MYTNYCIAFNHHKHNIGIYDLNGKLSYTTSSDQHSLVSSPLTGQSHYSIAKNHEEKKNEKKY